MKKKVFFVFSILALGMSMFAQMGMEEPRSVDAIVAEIEKQQNVTTLQEIIIEKVSPELLEELGDSVMDVVIGNPTMHDRMDKMLGGDGSPQLNSFHTDLAQQYLQNGGLNGVNLGGTWGMGRFGMMWGKLGFQTEGKIKTLEGKLNMVKGDPTIQVGRSVYYLDFPDFYYYAYNDGIKNGTTLKLEGYEFSTPSTNNPAYFSVKKAIINGKTYDFTGFNRGMMGGFRGGMMNGNKGGMMRGY